MSLPITKQTANNLIRLLQIPWECRTDDSPRTMCYDIDKQFGNKGHLSGNLFLHTAYKLKNIHSNKLYVSYVEIEARAGNTAITIGEIKDAEIEDGDLVLHIKYNDDEFFMKFLMI